MEFRNTGRKIPKPPPDREDYLAALKGVKASHLENMPKMISIPRIVRVRSRKKPLSE
jgi:hypothetical protein